MSFSQVQIVNAALMKFGSATITAITDSTPQARYASALWAIVRDAMLSAHPWNFAMKRVTLDTASATAPDFEYDYKYTLPSDCLRVWELYDTDANWTVEGGELYCSDEECYVRYIAQITDVTKWSMAFIRSFTIALAAELAGKITEAASKTRALLLQELDPTIYKAYTENTNEGNPARHKNEQDLSQGNLSWQTDGR